MKKLQFTVRDKSCGKVGKIRNIYGNDSGFSYAQIIYKDGTPSGRVPIGHLELLTLNGLNQHKKLEVVSRWNLMENGMPACGEPVLIKTSAVQHISYCFDASEDLTVGWFEPYHFEHDDEFKIPMNKVKAWMYLDDEVN